MTTRQTNNKSTSVVVKKTITNAATSRIGKSSIIKVASNLPLVGFVTGPITKVILNKISDNKVETESQPLPSTRAEMLNKRNAKAKPAKGCSFNLPPHIWSLPTRPTKVVGFKHIHNQKQTLEDIHTVRRGAIWFYDTGASASATDESGNQITAGDKRKAELAKSKKTLVKGDGETKKDDFNYGFQFLWNPEQISVAVARNMDVTPTSADRLRAVSGAFPGQENVSFSIVLDRVNDFAAIKSLVDNKKAEKSAFPVFGDEILKQYKYGLSDSDALAKISMNQKLYELTRYGTMADLEYLFKAINSSGPGGGWTTLLGKKTADIGFLAPTLLAFRFGPDSHESLSFVGWITNLSINHTMFTEDMIPLRTTVTFSVDCFAGSSLV